MQKQKAGKRKIYVFAVGMILLFLIGKYSGWSGRLLNGDLTQALQHITVEILPACHFIVSGGYRSGKCSFRFAGDQFCNPCGTAVWSGVGDDLLYSCSYFGSSCSFSLRQIFSERYSRGSCQKNPYLRRLLFDETGKNRSGS